LSGVSDFGELATGDEAAAFIAHHRERMPRENLHGRGGLWRNKADNRTTRQPPLLNLLGSSIAVENLVRQNDNAGKKPVNNAGNRIARDVGSAQ